MSSTRLIALHHREEIAAYLDQDPLLHVYAIGDLDDFFWPYTQWYGYEKDDALAAIALVYMGQATPTVLLFHRDTAALLEFVEHLQPHLPRLFYLHISPGCAAALRPHYTLEEHGTHCRMGLTHQDALVPIDTHDTARLEPSDIDAIWQLYKESYPGHWFDPRMLETGQYCGIWEGKRLISIAGIHVYSPHYRVAALGNITTHPDARGRGLARRTTAQLCKMLLQHVDHIALNVHKENHAAIALYQQLGFSHVAHYEEYLATPRR